MPPLRPDLARRLKTDFPSATIVLNGGLQSLDEALLHLGPLDGVMLGRQAYHDPWLLAEVDARVFGEPPSGATRADVVQAMIVHARERAACGVPLRSIVRHMLGLYHGEPGARQWRRMLSDARLLDRADAGLLAEALQHVERARGAPRAHRFAAQPPAAGAREPRM